MHERSFFAESRDLYRFRDYLLRAWADSLPPQPIIVVKGDWRLTPQPLPPMPDNIREALEGVNGQIDRLMQEHLVLRERERERRYSTHGANPR